MVITEYSLIGAILQYYPESAKTFEEMGMHCIACPSSARETLGQACKVHGVVTDELIQKLDEQINS